GRARNAGATRHGLRVWGPGDPGAMAPDPARTSVSSPGHRAVHRRSHAPHGHRRVRVRIARVPPSAQSGRAVSTGLARYGLRLALGIGLVGSLAWSGDWRTMARHLG